MVDDVKKNAVSESGTVAKAFRGERKARTYRCSDSLAAKECIGPLVHGCSIFGLTMGQFSLMNVLTHIIDEVGPAEIVVATWTAAGAAIEEASRLVSRGDIVDMRWVVDRSFKSRQPELCRILDGRFPGCVRTTRSHAKFLLTRSHAKFLLIGNDDWHVVVKTSMNLNQNPRIEDFDICDDPELYGYLLNVVNELWGMSEASNYGGNELGKVRLPAPERSREGAVSCGNTSTPLKL